MVEIFKTNVQEDHEAIEIVHQFLERFPTYVINFDLEDCDKILRIEGNTIDAELICMFMEQVNVQCSVL